MMMLNLIQNLALLVTLSVVHHFIFRRMQQHSLKYQFLSGFLYGGITVIGMLTPVQLMNGIFFDGRSIILSTAGIFGGPVVAATAALISGGFRCWLGGAGLWMGLGVIIEATALGVAFHYLRKKHSNIMRVPVFWGFGMLVHVIMVMLMYILPGGVGPQVASQIAFPVILLYPVVNTLACLIFLEQERYIQTDRALRDSEERYRRLFHNNHAVMLLVCPETGNIIEASPAACKYYGWSHDELVGMRISDINVSPPEQIRADMSSAKAEQRNYFVFQHRRADGLIRDVEVYSGPITVHGRDLLYSIIHDITDRKLAEAALEESKEDLNRAQMVANVGSWHEEFQGNTLRCSDEMYRILEIPGGMPITRESYLDCVHPEDRGTVGYIWEMTLHGKSFEIEHRLLMKNGTVKWVNEICLIDADAEGNPVRSMGIIQDISTRKRAEEVGKELSAIREILWNMKTSDDFFNLTASIYQELKKLQIGFHALGINIVQETGPERYDVRVSQIHEDGSFEDITGVTGSRIIYDIWKSGKVAYRKDLAAEDGFREQSHLGDNFRAVIRAVVDIPFSHGTVAINSTQANAFSEWDISVLIKTADILSEGFRRLDDLKKLENYTRELENEISTRKKSEEVLRESEANLRRAQEIAHIGSWRFDMSSRRVFISEESRQIYGLDDREWFIGEVQSIPLPEYREALDTALRNLIGTGAPYSIEYRIRRLSDGALHDIHSRAEYDRESDMVTGTIQDITDRKALEHQLLQSQKMETIGRLAGGVAHDFNNILTVINVTAEMALAEMNPGNPFRSAFADIGKAGERAAGLTRQLLAFSRKQIIEPKVININHILLEMDKMLRRLIGEHIELVTILDDSLWQTRVDPGQVEQVLTNLVVNARDAMPQSGKLTIETENVTLDEHYTRNHSETVPGRYVMFAVSDTGVGMDKETLSHLFEPFFTTKPKGSGTGLGLSTCYGIVKQNNGSIWVYSEPGQGTTVKVYLPAVAQIVHSVAAGRNQSILFGGTETVLVVDDEPSTRTVVARVLEHAGYRVYEASNGSEALSRLEEIPEAVHLLVTDVVMPLMGGRELANRLCSRYPKVKVLFMSGYTDNAIVHHGVLDEGLNFIQKPFSMVELIGKIKTILNGIN